MSFNFAVLDTEPFTELHLLFYFVFAVPWVQPFLYFPFNLISAVRKTEPITLCIHVFIYFGFLSQGVSV